MCSINKLITFIVVVMMSACVQSGIVKKLDYSVSEDIRVNQLGYIDGYTKKFSVANTQASQFDLLDEGNNVVFSGTLVDLGFWPQSGETLKTGDFSSVNTSGRDYKVMIADKGVSYSFDIGTNLYQKVLIDAAKSFYLQRASIVIEEKYAGRWSRDLGHPDTNVLLHPSTGLEGTVSAPKGWYDAGDFGKYVVNGSVSASQMLALYELLPSQYQDGSLNIPESNNGENDLLDEIKYQLDWLLNMQDSDGGVFHKLTTKRFAGMVLASEANKQRWMMAKSTSASLDFAAVMAQAARIYKDDVYSRVLLDAAQRAWRWSLKNRNVSFSNAEDVVTGQYPDSDFTTEFFWAAAELYTTTQKVEYLDSVRKYIAPLEMLTGESWRTYLGNMGIYSMLHHASSLPQDLSDSLAQQLISLADSTIEAMNENAYSTAVEKFEWGSNSDILNALVTIAHAYVMTSDVRYLDAVIQGVDYIFGRNATGYSFFTGYGDKQPMFIHHRQSSADGIVEPIPGFVVGGPNGDQQDAADVKYLHKEPAKSYKDVEPSYASNEVAVNWNAPLVFVLGVINASL